MSTPYYETHREATNWLAVIGVTLLVIALAVIAYLLYWAPTRTEPVQQPQPIVVPVQPGPSGPAGPQGEPGPSGPQGEPGTPAPSSGTGSTPTPSGGGGTGTPGGE
jgi:hypothetical protein